MSLSGPFRTVKTETFKTDKEAFEAIKKYAEAGGYTNIKYADDPEELDGARVIGKTPGGRSGRNVAFID